MLGPFSVKAAKIRMDLAVKNGIFLVNPLVS